MIVVLMGYMGSGKSTIGKELATLLKYNFLDLDDYISEKENATISDIFKDKGEIYFRKKETEYLKEIINSYNDIVLALGGGTPCYGNNLKILNDWLFFLHVDLYRSNEAEDIHIFDLDRKIHKKKIIIIEWPQKLVIERDFDLKIFFEHFNDGRKVSIKDKNKLFQDLIKYYE